MASNCWALGVKLRDSPQGIISVSWFLKLLAFLQADVNGGAVLFEAEGLGEFQGLGVFGEGAVLENQIATEGMFGKRADSGGRMALAPELRRRGDGHMGDARGPNFVIGRGDESAVDEFSKGRRQVGVETALLQFFRAECFTKGRVDGGIFYRENPASGRIGSAESGGIGVGDMSGAENLVDFRRKQSLDEVDRENVRARDAANGPG